MIFINLGIEEAKDRALKNDNKLQILIIKLPLSNFRKKNPINLYPMFTEHKIIVLFVFKRFK